MSDETCEYCGSAKLAWRKCKQVCLDCGQINRSCADLAADDRGGGSLGARAPLP